MQPYSTLFHRYLIWGRSSLQDSMGMNPLTICQGPKPQFCHDFKVVKKRFCPLYLKPYTWTYTLEKHFGKEECGHKISPGCVWANLWQGQLNKHKIAVPCALGTCTLYQPVDLCATPSCTLQGYEPVLCTNLLTYVWHLAVPFRVTYLYFVHTF